MKNNKLNTLYSRYVKIIFSRFNFWKFVGSYLIRFANCAQREVWLYFFPLGLNKWNSWWKDGYFFTNILSTFLQTHKHTYLLGKKIQKNGKKYECWSWEQIVEPTSMFIISLPLDKACQELRRPGSLNP